MKKILIALSCTTLLISSCSKHHNDAQPGSLTRITDSSGTFHFSYTGGKITSAYKSDLHGLPLGTITFEYPDHHVKIRSSFPGSRDIIDIYLNDSSLPVSMHDLADDTVLYYYKPGTIHLDSVFSFSRRGIPRSITYTFRYDGDNISRVIVRNSGFIDSVMFVYKPNTPNLFKTSAPLFFIYSDLYWFGPLTDSNAPYMYKTFFFVRAFSAGTIDNYTFTIGGRTGWAKYPLLTADNKVTQEIYPNTNTQNYFYN